jgi:AraC-like DNA-binding protein
MANPRRRPPPTDQGVNWSFAPLDHMRFMRAKYVQHSFVPHAHDYFVLGIIEDGIQTFSLGRARYVTTPGKLILINPGEIHTGEAAIQEGFAYRALYPSVNLLTSSMREFRTTSPQSPYFPSGTIDDQPLFRHIQHLHRYSEISAPEMALEEKLLAFFISLIQRHALNALTLPRYEIAHQAVRITCDYLEAHYAEPITLSDLSKQVYITPYHLARLFTRHVGVPPHKYLENIRVREAERLLKTGLSIADTAYATGFSSQSHLTRTFKRFLGTTPGEFLQQRKIL